MMRFFAATVAALSMLLIATTASISGEMVHRVAVHVDQNDKKVMNLALNNVQNLNAYYEAKGEKVIIELVAYGPGLHMYRADTSPVKARIETMSLAMPNLQLSACGNTHRKMSKKAGKKIEIMSEAKMIPSGVIRLIELQESGYAYIKP